MNNPQNDYPVLYSCLFCQIWLAFIYNKSLTSMGELFYCLNRSSITLKPVNNGATNTCVLAAEAINAP